MTPNEIDQLRRAALARPDDVTAQMRLGEALHATGQPELAWQAFERARTLAPADSNIASACASVLCEIGRTQAAWAVMETVKEALLASADGAANLGIVAELCARDDVARAAYDRALELDPRHLRALNNLGLMAARSGDWSRAIERLSTCVQLAPDAPVLQANLADMLAGGRRYAQAAQALRLALQLQPDALPWRVRLYIVLAFAGEFEQAASVMDSLGPQGPDMLREFLNQPVMTIAKPLRKELTVLPDARELFVQQVFERMVDCDWSEEERITSTLRAMLAEVRGGNHVAGTRDWRDAQFHSHLLPMTEAEQTELRNLNIEGLLNLFPKPVALRNSRVSQDDQRYRIGIGTQNLADERHVNALARQLALHDRSRFSLRIYSPTPKPQLRFAEPLQPYVDGYVELAHMTHDEATQRVRVDRLDLWLDTAFFTPWCRVEMAYRRVAPVQIFSQTWARYHPSPVGFPYEYSVGDRITHPEGVNSGQFGPIALMPNGCWLACNDDLPESPAPTREQAGLPARGLVLCAWAPAIVIDRASFALWMQVLRELPEAVLWLAPAASAARANLQLAARAAGIDPARLVFAATAPRAQTLARIAHADLFMDTLRFSATYAIADALRMGVPCVTVLGHNMASRLGASILHAAGQAAMVMPTPEAMRDRIVELCRDPARLAQARAEVAAGRDRAAHFDHAARVREWESMWTIMIERQRRGLPPQAFEVPAAQSSF